MFDVQTKEKLALYLGYGNSFYIFEQKLQFRDLTPTTEAVILNILLRIADLDRRAIESVGVNNGSNNLKKVEDIEFFENSSSTNQSETYLYYAAQQVELLSKLLGIPLLYNIYNISGCSMVAVQIR